MPFTPYHFGPSGFVGLVFRKWIDIPVFVLVNVIVDIEVLLVLILQLGSPHHRYCHTLLVGSAVGALWGMSAYPLRGLFSKAMRALNLPYETSFWRMALSGALGACMHVLIDGAYHHDAAVFWPNTTISLWRILRQYLTREQGRIICIGLLLAAITYVFVLIASSRNTAKSETDDLGERS